MNREDGSTDSAALQGELLVHADFIRGYVAARIPSRLTGFLSADDILQEVWIAAFRRLPEFQMLGKGSVSRWLTTIANNKLIDALKANQAFKRRGQSRSIVGPERGGSSTYANLLAQAVSPVRTPSGESSTRENATAIRRALESLPEDHRCAIQMRYIEGRSREEIANAMQKPLATINNLLFSGLRSLRQRMGRASRFLSGGSSHRVK